MLSPPAEQWYGANQCCAAPWRRGLSRELTPSHSERTGPHLNVVLHRLDARRVTQQLTDARVHDWLPHDLLVEQLRDEADVAQRPLLDAPLRRLQLGPAELRQLLQGACCPGFSVQLP